MTNNDVFRRLRYCFDFNDKKVIKLFALAEHDVTRTEISEWLKQDDDADFKNLSDKLFATFLNGLIIDKRGKKEGVVMQAESRLNNNLIFKKLKIAFNLKSEDILDLMRLAEFRMSEHELSAFFRKAGHKHYRDCKDQILRNFLNGLTLKYRDKKVLEKTNPWTKNTD